MQPDQYRLYVCITQEKKQAAMALMLEAQNIVDTSPPSPATDVFRTVVSTFKSNMDDLLLRAEPKRKELDVLVQLHRFCEQVGGQHGTPGGGQAPRCFVN